MTHISMVIEVISIMFDLFAGEFITSSGIQFWHQTFAVHWKIH